MLKQCRYNLTDSCLNKSDSTNFHGMCCKPCLSAKNEIYYVAHRDSSFLRYYKRPKIIKETGLKK